MVLGWFSLARRAELVKVRGARGLKTKAAVVEELIDGTKSQKVALWRHQVAKIYALSADCQAGDHP